MIRSIVISLSLITLTASPTLSQNARLHVAGSGDQVVASAGYDAAVFARRLGHVSAIARHADGTLYTADRDSGRIFRIQDRRLDGVADLTQALPQLFDRPTGLVVAGETLFVSDQGGLWRVQLGGGTPTLIAPFANSGATNDAHPTTMVGPTSLLLGLSLTNGTAQLLNIDTISGTATLREEARGRIIGFSSTLVSDNFPAPWVLLQRDDTVLFGPTLQSVRDIEVDAQAVWINETNGQARLSLPDGVFETIATFAGLKNKGSPILSGFGGDARPGVMISDRRGLFVADQAGGRLWRLSPTADIITPTPDIADPKPEPEANPRVDRAIDPAKDRSTRPDLMRGSGIDSASTIGRASTMPSASTMPEADQPRAASDPNE